MDRGKSHVAADDDFASLVRPHLVAMANLAARLVGPTRRDDVVQEALTRAWRRRSTYDPARGTYKTWLLAILAGEAKRPKWYRREEPLLGRGDKSSEPDTQIDIERAIDRLSERQRLAVALHYFVDLDIDACARVMECAPGTVKSTLYDARQHLRRYLEETRLRTLIPSCGTTPGNGGLGSPLRRITSMPSAGPCTAAPPSWWAPPQSSC